MPVFRFDKAFGMARDAKAFLNRATRGAPPDAEQAEYRKKIKSQRQARRQERQARRQKKQALRQKKQALRQERQERLNKDEKGKKRQQKMFQLQQKMFQLKRELIRLEGEFDTEEKRTEGASAGEPETGALPDFAVIGVTKGGTTFLYHLLTQHPHVERAAMKEPHYFDRRFDYGTEWYRGCFPKPRWKDGRRTITGEASPGYLFRPCVPERMAEVVPRARLIALLRNPVDRAYSNYKMRIRKGVRKGLETRTFEEAIQAEKTQLLGKEAKAFEREDRASSGDPDRGYLSRGIYVDHLRRWSRLFGEEQMLVLKSEDFFERPAETLKPVLGFLGLPDWEPPASVLGNERNTGKYERGMDPATRRRLEEFFEPHNQRLYEYLGKDFGW